MSSTSTSSQLAMSGPRPQKTHLPKLWDWKTGLAILAVCGVLFLSSQLVVGVIAIVTTIATMSANGGVASVEDMTPEMPPVATVLSMIGLAVACGGSVTVVGAIGKKYNLAQMGLGKTTFKYAGIAIALGVALAIVRMGLAAVLVDLFPFLNIGIESLNNVLFPDTGPLGTAMMLLLTILVLPFTEEIFYRGFVHNWMRNGMGAWPAIVLSSLAFGFIHLIPIQIAMAIPFGIAAAWIYEKSGSLWPAVLLHVANNLVAMLASIYLPAHI